MPGLDRCPETVAGIRCQLLAGHDCQHVAATGYDTFGRVEFTNWGAGPWPGEDGEPPWASGYPHAEARRMT